LVSSAFFTGIDRWKSGMVPSGTSAPSKRISRAEMICNGNRFFTRPILAYSRQRGQDDPGFPEGE
jgi:hypothetical protein